MPIEISRFPLNVYYFLVLWCYFSNMILFISQIVINLQGWFVCNIFNYLKLMMWLSFVHNIELMTYVGILRNTTLIFLDTVFYKKFISWCSKTLELCVVLCLVEYEEIK